MCSALGKSTFLGECLHSLGWALLLKTWFATGPKNRLLLGCLFFLKRFYFLFFKEGLNRCQFVKTTF